MALKDIMAISGQSGLFKLVSQARNGIIVESLADGKRNHIPASAKVSALSDISIYTNASEASLREVLLKIKEMENAGPTISQKSSNDEFRTFFAKVLPDYDVNRVYVSDIKKVVTWYNQLQSLNIMDFSEPEEKNKEDEVKDGAVAEVTEKKSTAKPKSTKKAPAKPKAVNAVTSKASSKAQTIRKTQPIKRAE